MRSLAKINLPGLATLCALLVLWEAFSRNNVALKLYLPPVSQILISLFELAFSQELWGHLFASLGRFLTGYLLAGLGAVVCGVVLGYSRLAYSLSDALIEFLRPMPSVAIIPVAILFLGIGSPMMVAVTMYACAWPVLINTIDGVRNIDRTLLDTARTFGLGRWQALQRVVLPAASPYIVTGLRVSLAIALILVTTSEMVVGGSGLGFFILDEERSLRTSNMYAAILLVAVLGYSLNRLFLLLEGRVMAWHRGMTSGESL